MSSAHEDEIDVAYVAQLARLKLDEDEAALFQAQLADIVGYVRKVSEPDVSGVEATAHGMAVENVFRKDEVRDGMAHDDAMANAPAVRHGLFVVPKILE